MPAYLIVDLQVHDADRYEACKREVPRFMQKYGGEYIVRGGEHEVIEGTWRPQRLVVMRFPSRQAKRPPNARGGRMGCLPTLQPIRDAWFRRNSLLAFAPGCG